MPTSARRIRVRRTGFDPQKAAARRAGLVDSAGKFTSQSVLSALFQKTGELTLFAARFFRTFSSKPREWRELLHQMDELGSKSFFLVLITGISTGVVLAMQSRGTLSAFGAEAMLPDMLVMVVFKEFGPVFTSIVLAGRLGAGIVAEIGSMRVTEQIDAMEAAALRPFNYLVVTRVIACVILFPVLTIFVDVIAVSGGFLEASLVGGMDYMIYLETAFQTIRLTDVIVDTGKTCIFGFIVGIVSCFLGYTVRGGAREVGQAAMQSVVLSTLLILISDLVIVRLSLTLFGDVSG